ncbi:hypothetical protein M409DRAFT_30589 [Zasmidium cellare ATCC 36951]|uniref:RNase III domain-containing protein n=1 Tax=Zasmidium cellare ATCC 36951 TaxID=1080233 RepID=A0A6A6BZU3_ZASCE|nr:uncharacterized protein M409DRAFT_30589 [Zasmidium cellare ATCC 36951]KAF2158966.1 hypothetical protein M409DRAFT_30589 [Zasmidium cellare ATCC 36951]
MERTTNAEKLIAYAFTNRDLLKEALVAAGSREVKNVDIRHDGANKGLAMVGDALIRLIIVDEWFSGQETRAKCEATVQKLACNEHLSTQGHEANVDSDIFKATSQKGVVAVTTMATTVEAIIGAAWYDSGKTFEVVHSIVKKAIE